MSTRTRRRRRRWFETGPIKVLGVLVALGVVAMVLVVAFNGTVHKALNELTLPLEHEDIIRQQSKEKGVDAALIAAVIDTESKFVASAECELLPGDRTRVIDLTPGKPGDADKWWDPS